MNEKEALEMLKSLKFDWIIDLYKIPDMCDYFFNLQQQLQAYKDKEEKLREFCNNEIDRYGIGACITPERRDYETCCKQLLQILNEGSDE